MNYSENKHNNSPKRKKPIESTGIIFNETNLSKISDTLKKSLMTAPDNVIPYTSTKPRTVSPYEKTPPIAADIEVENAAFIKQQGDENEK